MVALILAAGLGTRLRPLTDQIPKPMVPINGKPLLEYLITHVAANGIKEICMNLHYLPEQITDYFGDGARWGVKIIYKFEPIILGTAGAIKNFEDVLTPDFLLLYGDMLHRIDLQKLIVFHRAKGGVGTVAVGKTDDPQIKDVVELEDEGRVTRLVAKPHDIVSLSPFQWNMQAVYAFRKDIVRDIPPSRYVELDHEILPAMLKNQQAIYGYKTEEPIFDIGTWENYQKAEEFMNQLDSRG